MGTPNDADSFFRICPDGAADKKPFLFHIQSNPGIAFGYQCFGSLQNFRRDISQQLQIMDAVSIRLVLRKIPFEFRGKVRSDACVCVIGKFGNLLFIVEQPNIKHTLLILISRLGDQGKQMADLCFSNGFLLEKSIEGCFDIAFLFNDLGKQLDFCKDVLGNLSVALIINCSFGLVIPMAVYCVISEMISAAAFISL